jgi:hypothetical protein
MVSVILSLLTVKTMLETGTGLAAPAGPPPADTSSGVDLDINLIMIFPDDNDPWTTVGADGRSDDSLIPQRGDATAVRLVSHRVRLNTVTTSMDDLSNEILKFDPQAPGVRRLLGKLYGDGRNPREWMVVRDLPTLQQWMIDCHRRETLSAARPSLMLVMQPFDLYVVFNREKRANSPAPTRDKWLSGPGGLPKSGDGSSGAATGGASGTGGIGPAKGIRSAAAGRRSLFSASVFGVSGDNDETPDNTENDIDATI